MEEPRQQEQIKNQKLKALFKDPQTFIAIGVTIISLCALIVSLMQTTIMREERELMREHSRASVWPSLSLTRSKSHNPDNSLAAFSLILSNDGVGPAIITDVKVTYKGKEAEDWWELFDIMEIPDTINTAIGTSSFNETVVKIGESKLILNLDNNLPLAQEFYKYWDEVKMDIYYKSIYDEQWKYDLDNSMKLEGFKGLTEEEQFY